MYDDCETRTASSHGKANTKLCDWCNPVGTRLLASTVAENVTNDAYPTLMVALRDWWSDLGEGGTACSQLLRALPIYCLGKHKGSCIAAL